MNGIKSKACDIAKFVGNNSILVGRNEVVKGDYFS